MQMHIPQDIAAWAVFGAGLIFVAYRIHGIDAPRTWVELLERQFTYATNLRFLGGILLAAVVTVVYLARPNTMVMTGLYLAGMSVLALIGLCLLLFQNHLRSLVFATAEGTDQNIRIMSIIIVMIGLGFMLAPFFF